MTTPRPIVVALAAGVLSVTALASCSSDSETSSAASTSTTATESAKAAEERAPKSLVIGIDGATFAVMEGLELPNISALGKAGMTARSNVAGPDYAPTLSGPGWSSMVTGVWPDKHQVFDNEFVGANFDEYPDYLTRIEGYSPDSDTYVSGTWTAIPTLVFGPTVDRRAFALGDGKTTEQAVEHLEQPEAENVFVDLDHVDASGHDHGSASEEYAAALTAADERVGLLVDAVEGRPTFDDEDWLIVLSTDHGHTPEGGHGGGTPAEREIFVIAVGTGIEPSSVRRNVKLVDIAPTVLVHQGVPIDPAWNLDGTPLAELEPDDFDTVYDRLQTPADETELPAETIGWTRDLPKGWSTDETDMPSGGPQEWSGWTLTTDDYWTNTKLGEGREANVRSRDVFAVADPTRWRTGNPDEGQFTATLIGPDFEVEGGKDAKVTYVTTYRHAFRQSAEVLVSFDGAEPVRIKAYGDKADANTTERITMRTPEGATSAQVSFAYLGGSGGFWAIDQVSMATEG